MSEARVPALLIVEDDLALQKQLRWSLDRYEAATASDAASAVLQFRKVNPGVVTMDLGLPPDQDGVGEGFRLLERLLELDPYVKVIVLTGQNDQSNALRAVRMGAYDFLAKPVDPDVLALTVERAMRLRELQDENRRLAIGQEGPLAGLLTRDAGMQRVCRTIEKVARADATVLLQGAKAVSWPSIARPFPRTSWSRSCLATRKALSRAQRARRRARSKSPTAVRSCWTRLAICRTRCRPSCCASCKSAPSSDWAGGRRSRLTFAWWAPRTKT
jgi:FixJ family two-component response regulator